MQLYREHDDMYTDLDTVCVEEFEENERLRRREIQAGVRQKRVELNKRIYYEIGKWRVRDNNRLPNNEKMKYNSTIGLPNVFSHSKRLVIFTYKNCSLKSLVTSPLHLFVPQIEKQINLSPKETNYKR